MTQRFQRLLTIIAITLVAIGAATYGYIKFDERPVYADVNELGQCPWFGYGYTKVPREGPGESGDDEYGCLRLD